MDLALPILALSTPGKHNSRIRYSYPLTSKPHVANIRTLCIQWGHLPNTRPGNFFLHVEYPRPPPPRGAAAVLVLDGKCGNGHGNWVHAVMPVRDRPEWVSARGCERVGPGTF